MSNFKVSAAGIFRTALTLVFTAYLALAMGCSFSASSESSSDIISSPFESSSASSGGDVEAAYREETEGYTVAYLETGATDAGNFQKGMSAIAAGQGISDWEAHESTWTSVGRALASADIGEASMLDYAQAWSAGDEDKVLLVRQGYTQLQ